VAIVLYDTLERKKVELLPREPGRVRMYVCGPTVYNFVHLGNGRPYVFFDVVARHLRARGLQVTYARNLTDVDDKIIKRAAELGEDPASLTARFTAEYHRDMAALGCLAPDVEPTVTGHIPEIIAIIEQLIANGRAYASDGDVYFSVASFDSYGRLSGQPLDALQAGARVEVAEHGDKKRDLLDFALWKAAKPGEPSWPSPWGAGRPGWHIECSAMAARHLGDSFDIHGGGVDLTFPHHENERAQSLGAHGDGTFAKYWMHNGFVNWNGKKIAKSDAAARVLFDRAFRLRVLIERHSGEAVRLFLLGTHYRNPINFEVLMPEGADPATAPLSFPGLEEAERRIAYGYTTMQRLEEALAVGKPAGPGAVAPESASWLETMRAALDDDFNTAEALAAHGEALALANRVLDGKYDAPKDVRRRTLERLHADLKLAAAELGLLEGDAAAWLQAHRDRRCRARNIDVSYVDGKIAERATARAAKDFARADALRAELAAAGVEIMDGPRGTTWRVAD
jgi:cysteinyl-tRNA synthetase